MVRIVYFTQLSNTRESVWLCQMTLSAFGTFLTSNRFQLHLRKAEVGVPNELEREIVSKSSYNLGEEQGMRYEKDYALTIGSE